MYDLSICLYTWASNDPIDWGHWNKNIKIREVPYSRYYQIPIAKIFYWFWNKIDQPEKFDLIPNDDGTVSVKELKPLEKSRMPHFGLEHKEIEALVTLIMGLVKDEIPPSKLPDKSPAYLAIAKGEQFLHTNNCLGCHKLDDEGGAIWPATADWLKVVADETNSEDMSLVQSFSPPLLNTQGRKTQPQWLLNWFKDVSMIRPHLQARMPSFDYTDEEWNTIISYFQYKDGKKLNYEDPHKFVMNSSSYKAGERIAEMGACNNCHFYGTEFPTQVASTWAPNLALTKERLNPEWVVDWMRAPGEIMPGTKMPAPYLPTPDVLETDDAVDVWGKDLVKLKGNQEAMLEGLRDYMWNIQGKVDISKEIKEYFDENGYDFMSGDEGEEDDDEWDDEDW